MPQYSVHMTPLTRPLLRALRLMALFLAIAPLSSCIRDEEPNTEADIEATTVHVSDACAFFFSPADSLQLISSTDTVIRFDVRHDADLTSLAPTFTITPGARLRPASGSVHDFSNGGVHYEVVAQDGRHRRGYTVVFRRIWTDHPEDNPDEVREVALHFEDAALGGTGNRFWTWQESNGVMDENCWSSGNGGYFLCKSMAPPQDYPTSLLEEGVLGHGVRLETRSTLPFGDMIKNKMPIAAGNFYIGTFDANYALLDAMKATVFGRPFSMKPLRLMGWYQYTPGPVYQDRAKNPVPGREDEPDIYAVLFRNVDETGATFYLHGDDVQTSWQIVAFAQMDYQGPTSGWTYFDVPFQYLQPLDREILRNRGYSLTVVAASSREGARFCGAPNRTETRDGKKIDIPGSVLLIDEFCLVCQP